MRTIAVFTGNRAEYGLQFPILKSLKSSKDADYKLIVSGAHLDPNFGNTLQEIRMDGFDIYEEVNINLESDDLFSTSKAIGCGVIEIAKVLEKLKPDFFVVYADRFEGLAAVIASTQMGIPTAHIEGGDITEGGALDDSVRHAMTKLSHLHFTTNEEATKRISDMGEEDWRIHTVGFPAIDLISEGNYAKPDEIVKKLGICLSKPIVLFTQHSVTTEFSEAKNQLTESLKALNEIANQDIQVILTYPNNDAGGLTIVSELEKFKFNKPENLYKTNSLGRYFYHGILALAETNRVCCAGNSSSGIKETPALKCPTVNIGSRQDGRLRGSNVIDANYSSQDISKAILKCLFDESFIETCRTAKNPYFLGGAGKKIVDILLKTEINSKLLQKKMTLKY